MPINFPVGPPTIGEKRERMQRVRVGMTGLAAVGLIVVVATAVATSVRQRAADTAALSDRPNVVATMSSSSRAAEKTEPLAQLGVAPDANDAATSSEKRAR